MAGTPVLTAAEMREAERLAIDDAGILGLVLMENAGRAVADRAAALLDGEQDALIVVVCGRGNNGGDGLVAARHLAQQRYDVRCLLVGQRSEVKGDALRQLDIADALGVPVVEVSGHVDVDCAELLAAADLIIDALFGIGLDRPVTGLAAEVIAHINDAGAPVLAVDLPSGIHSDTGRIMGAAVVANTTVTFAYPKRGLVVYPGAGYAGSVEIADIGIPDAVVEHVGAPAELVDDLEAPFLPERAAESHKGHYGHIVVLGGAPGKAGAALLAGTAALRGGAGLVSIGTHARCQASLEGRQPELMVEAAYNDTHVDVEALGRLLDAADVVVLGPGLPTGAVGRDVVERVLDRGEVPVVLDAGALDVVSRAPELLRSRASPLVLTPHPGEAARLLGTDSAVVQADRFAAVAELVDRSMAITVLKGARSLVADPEGRLAILPNGNPGMATAGTGDVLAGLVGAFLARELEPFEAVRAAAFVHAAAGDRAAAVLGVDSLLASDVLAALPAVLTGRAAGEG